MSRCKVVPLDPLRKARDRLDARLDAIAARHPHLIDKSEIENTEQAAEEWTALLLETHDMETKQQGLRLPVDLIERLDELAKRLEAERPGSRVTRSDAIRVAILRGLEALEAEHGGKRRKR